MKSKISDNRLETKERIIQVATKLFARKSYDGVSIRDICKEANVNISMISYYWGGKHELYQDILNEVILKQKEFVSQFWDIKTELTELTKSEQINLFFLLLDKAVDFLYCDKVSDDFIILLIKEQHFQNANLQSPYFAYFRKLLACILDKKDTDREVVLDFTFIIAQINSPRVFPVFSLQPLNRTTFTKEDKEIIKNNIKLYVNTLLKEANIEV